MIEQVRTEGLECDRREITECRRFYFIFEKYANLRYYFEMYKKFIWPGKLKVKFHFFFIKVWWPEAALLAFIFFHTIGIFIHSYLAQSNEKSFSINALKVKNMADVIKIYLYFEKQADHVKIVVLTW
jgi:hypothetical protein